MRGRDGGTSRASRAERRAAEDASRAGDDKRKTAFESEPSQPGRTDSSSSSRPASADSGDAPRASRVSLTRRAGAASTSVRLDDVSPRARRAPPRGGDARGPPRVAFRASLGGRRARVGGRGAPGATPRCCSRPSRSARAQVRARVPLAPRRPRRSSPRSRRRGRARGRPRRSRARSSTTPRPSSRRGHGGTRPSSRPGLRSAARLGVLRAVLERDRRTRRRGPSERAGGRRRGTRRVVDGGLQSTTGRVEDSPRTKP